jgi:hypothetical protein
MCNLRRYLWITISVSALAILASDRVLAKPQVRSKAIKPVATSQTFQKVVVDDAISPQPIEAILANVRLKPAPANYPGRAVHQKVVTTKSATTVVTPTRHVQADRSSQGVANFVGTNQPKSQANKSKATGIDRWIDD